MKHVIFRPEIAWRHYARTFFEQHLHIRRHDKQSTGYDVFVDSPEQDQTQEKPPIGIETSMFYIAIPVGLAAWVSLIYLVKFLLF